MDDFHGVCEVLGVRSNMQTLAVTLLKIASARQSGEAGAQQPECTQVHEDCEHRLIRYHGMHSIFKLK
jgi:hypothetical protein